MSNAGWFDSMFKTLYVGILMTSLWRKWKGYLFLKNPHCWNRMWSCLTKPKNIKSPLSHQRKLTVCRCNHTLWYTTNQKASGGNPHHFWFHFLTLQASAPPAPVPITPHSHAQHTCESPLHFSNWDATLISFLTGALPLTPRPEAGFLLEGPTVGGEP